ncbi:MAG: hypothetical protein OXH76_21385, partial [Boseongicola sp.]|nr:hypothetical protein [Boseongicola sp.]
LAGVLLRLCIGISLFLTYYGFERTFGSLTIHFTGVIGLLLFAADCLIQRNRERGLPWVPAFLLFLLAAVFSGLSNFSYLYTNFMTSDVLAATVREQYRVFQEDLTDTRTHLMGQQAVSAEDFRRQRIENELQNMWTQVNDPERPGCGERCAAHIDGINALLGESVTELRRPGPESSPAQRRSFHDAFRNRVQETLDNQNATGRSQEIRSVVSLVDERLDYFGNADDALRAGVDLGILSQLSDDTEGIEREANAVLPDGQKVDHRYIEPTLGRLGEIVYSLRNGFVEVPSPSTTVMALILSILVDFVPVLYALVAFRAGEGIMPEPADDDCDVLDG